MTDAPLIVSLLLGEETQARFEAERAALFPEGRTVVGAHVTLFHALPSGLRDDVATALAEAASGPALTVRVQEVYSLGGGVAYRLACPALARLHAQWQARWQTHLTRQDAQPLRLHVTVQNKVTGAARRTLVDLRDGFEPWTTPGWRWSCGGTTVARGPTSSGSTSRPAPRARRSAAAAG